MSRGADTVNSAWEAGLEAHSRSQHAAGYGWPMRYRIDMTRLTIEESLVLVRKLVRGE